MAEQALHVRTAGWNLNVTPQLKVDTNLAATVHLGLKPDAGSAPDVDSPHPLGSIDLVTTDGHEVNVVFIDIDGDLAHSLCCVCVEEHLALSAHLAYLLGGLDDTCMQQAIS